ncbi:MAG: adenylate/guanylate cyclase domain-containing protein [Pseudomonadota bacterium]
MYAHFTSYVGWHRYSANCALALAIAYITLLYLANGLLTLELSVNVSASSRESGTIEWLRGALATRDLVSTLTPAQAAWAFWPLQLLLIAFSVTLCITRKSSAFLACLAALFVVLVLYHGSGDLSLLRFGVFSVCALFLVSSAVQMAGAMFERHQLADAFEQFVPPEVARQVANDPGALQQPETVRELSVLFCDMKGFTGIAEQLTPSQLTGLLNRYFDVVTRVVIRHRGTIDKYMGDAVMAFWGAPVSSRDHASQAVQAARDIQVEMQTLARDFQLVQLPPIRVGIGVSTGESFVGHLGSDHRKAYTVIGDSVNVAQRLERATREFAVGVIVSEATAERDRATAFRELGTIRLKGRERALRVYQPVGRRDQLSQALKDELAQHEQAMALLRTRQWAAARPLVTQLAEISTETALYNTYLAQITDATRPPRPDPRDTASKPG